MSAFTKDLIIKKIPDGNGDLFKVYLSFDYHIGSEDSEEYVRVPEGFVTDLASIPWFARWLIPKVDRHCQAAVVHDFLYHSQQFSRAKSDAIFLEAMEVLGVAKWKRLIMYKAVRLGGWAVWKKRTI